MERGKMVRLIPIAAILVVIAFSFLFTGLLGESSSSSNRLTMAVNGGGITDPPIGILEFDSGESVPVSAKADLGYTFAGWTGDICAIQNPSSADTIVTVDDNISIFANFIEDGPKPYFSLNQHWIEGYHNNPDEVNLEDPDSVFWHVFSRLPDQVKVYPSENYFYYMLHLNGRTFWGNIRLAAGHRELGELSFAYFEFDEFAYASSSKFTRSKVFTADDGVELVEIDHFTYIVNYRDKSVTFNMHRLPQNPPRLFGLKANEVFVERTFDESGYQFFLMFNEAKNYFFWVLNEEEGVPDILDPVGISGDIFRGRRSGFVFWEDDLGRKILATIRQQSITRNDYFDGPFDQLADNYAEEVNIREYMIKASPGLEGRIDQYGYFTDPGSTMRVALSTYGTHYYLQQALDFIDAAKAAEDTYQHISRRGASATPPATP